MEIASSGTTPVPSSPDPGLAPIVEAILHARERGDPTRATLVAITGIDGSGKGWVTARLIAALVAEGVHAVSINVDGWLHLPQKRFDPANPAEHFYRCAVRFDDMFRRLVLPLRDHRSIRVEVDHADETAAVYRPKLYEFDRVDVVVLEGIYLLKRAFRSHYDFSIWVDCSFETALERAILRGQEGLPADETVRAYREIYFPAQVIHAVRDDPRSAATLILNNDPRWPSPAVRSQDPDTSSRNR